MPVAKSKRRTQPCRRGNAEQGRRLGRRCAGSNPAPQTACPERLHEYRAPLMCTTVCWAYDLARVGKGQWCWFRAPGVLFGRCGGIGVEPSWGTRELGGCASSYCQSWRGGTVGVVNLDGWYLVVVVVGSLNSLGQQTARSGRLRPDSDRGLSG